LISPFKLNPEPDFVSVNTDSHFPLQKFLRLGFSLVMTIVMTSSLTYTPQAVSSGENEAVAYSDSFACS
jgi:hypothetical protein